jgi:hypothetical protein
LPEIVEPDLEIELAAITLMVGPTVGGGEALLPGSVFQVPPQAGGLGIGILAKPLKAVGALPPLMGFNLAHCELQKVTCWPITASLSPMTKLP